MSKRLLMVLVAIAVVSGGAVLNPVHGQAPAQQTAASPERTVWYFYRVKWGFQEEFVDLFRRNHYPVLKDQTKPGGRITSVRTFVPTYHGDGRADWTFAVVITYRNVEAMVGPSG